MTYPQFVASRCKPGADIFATLTPEKVHLWHMASKLCSEAGELMDAVAKHIIYNQPLDHINVLEEQGDIKFYWTEIGNIMGWTDRTIEEANMDKLTKRYPVAYSDKDAQERKDKKVWQRDGLTETDYPRTYSTGGMSLRDFFAAAALPSLVQSALDENHGSWNATAEHAYIIADAMLKERTKTP